MDKIRKSIFMFVDLFGLERYNFEKLVISSSIWPTVWLILAGRWHSLLWWRPTTEQWLIITGPMGSMSATVFTAFLRLPQGYTLLMRYEGWGLFMRDYFIIFQCLGLWIGAICHDIDHRGFNNKFMIDIGSPLAAVYSTSTMENHHFAMGVNILQQECSYNQFRS